MNKIAIILIMIFLQSCPMKNSNDQISENQISDTLNLQNNSNNLIINSNSNTKEYINTKYKFKISYPKKWTLLENFTQKNPSIFSIVRDPNNRQDPLNLTLTTATANGNKDTFYEHDIEQMLKEQSGIKIIKKNKIKINSYDCFTTIFEFNTNNKRMKFKQYLFIENGTNYYFTFTSDKARYNANINEFEQIVKSFKIIHHCPIKNNFQ